MARSQFKMNNLNTSKFEVLKVGDGHLQFSSIIDVSSGGV